MTELRIDDNFEQCGQVWEYWKLKANEIQVWETCMKLGKCTLENLRLAILFIFGGSWGPLCRTQGYQMCRAVRPHHRADKFITREKIITSFSYMGRNVKNAHFELFGGALNNRTGPILLPSYPLTYININIKYGNNQNEPK